LNFFDNIIIYIVSKFFKDVILVSVTATNSWIADVDLKIGAVLGNTINMKTKKELSMNIFKLFKMIFTYYLAALFIICGIVNGIIYPMILSDKKYPIEYRIGKYAGYAYLSFGVLILLVYLILN